MLDPRQTLNQSKQRPLPRTVIRLKSPFRWQMSPVRIIRSMSLTTACRVEARQSLSRRPAALPQLYLCNQPSTSSRPGLKVVGGHLGPDCRIAAAVAVMTTPADRENDDIPAEFTIIFSTGHSRRCYLRWRKSHEFGA